MIGGVRDVTELLLGVGDVRWSRMRHAYGSAAEVPALLLGLTDPSPAVRRTALDTFHGTAHHQGDVYGCTLAALPFLLRIAADTGRPGRAGVVALIGSIGGVGWDADSPPTGDLYRRARHEVAAAAPLWRTLLDDPDPEVRAAAAPVLAAGATTSATLREHSDGDPRVRVAVVEAVAGLARAGVEVEAAAGFLSAVLHSGTGPAERLAALTGLATLAGRPGVAEVDVRTALALLTTVTEKSLATDGLVRTISAGFGDRVDDRTTLLGALLRSDRPAARLDAVHPAGQLVNGWRGDHTGLVGLIGGLVADPDPRIAYAAVHQLNNLGALAAPAADALAGALAEAEPRVMSSRDDRNRVAWVIEWGDNPRLAPALSALARLGDPRALPMLRWTLERDVPPRDAGNALVAFGERAAGLVPSLRRLLAFPGSADAREDALFRDGVVSALAAIGPAAADAVPDLLAGPITDAVVRAFGRIGPDARDAAPLLRGLAAGPGRGAVAAARSLFAIEGDADAASAVYDRFLGGDRSDVSAAVDAIAGLGPHGAARATQLRRVLRRKDEHGWLHVAAARALWRTVADTGVLPVLERVWDATPRQRLEIATLWREMGVASGARVSAELARVRRHNVADGGFDSAAATNDEKLVKVLREMAG